jgi:uncharacterized protein
MRRTKEQILSMLEDNRAAIKRYGVHRLGLFGSHARGDDSETSDLDFVVEFETKSFDAYMDLKAFLEQLFGTRIDLVLESAVKPRLRAVISEEAVHAPGL